MSTFDPKLGLILNTRPAVYHGRFHEAFGDLPWAIYDCPLTHEEPISAVFPPPGAHDSLIFTSQIAVNLFFVDPPWRLKTVYAVGEATAKAAVRAGYARVIQTGENVDDLRQHLANDSFASALYPSATEVSADLAQEFLGRITRVPIYRMIARDGLPDQFAKMAARMHVVAPVFSRRNAVILADLMSKAGLTQKNSAVFAVGMSKDVFEGVQGAWQRQPIAKAPTMQGIVAMTRATIEALGP
ncbi:MAG: uroporphyrinogen-III synthase [Rhodospirillaceae bacterium]|nr:uroporphyrinogen-III synthase [Rhodospirillaceae bacterium]